MAELSWSLIALGNLDAIVDEVAPDSPLYAATFVQRVFDAAARLRSYPRMGRIVPEYGREDLRELIFQGYRILYRIDGEAVRVITIVHGARELARLLPAEPWNLV